MVKAIPQNQNSTLQTKKALLNKLKTKKAQKQQLQDKKLAIIKGKANPTTSSKKVEAFQTAKRTNQYNQKTMLKYLIKRDTIDSFYSGGNIEFFDDVCFGTCDGKVIQYNWQEKRIVDIIEHVSRPIISGPRRDSQFLCSPFSKNHLHFY